MFFKNLLFSFIIVAGFFLLAEFVLALAGVRPLLLSEDPMVGFADNMPQFVRATRKDGADMYITAENKLSLFNFQEFPQRKSDNAYRIFCVGGSTTFGRPYTDSLSFCGWLRAYLQAADPSREWQVINAGGISYASYRVTRVMNELENYEPDLFIVYSGQNEFLEQRSYGALREIPTWMINLDVALSGTRLYTSMKRAFESIRPNSSALSLKRDELGGEVDDILNHTLGPESYRRDEALKQQIIRHYRLNLVRMARIAESAGAGIVFIMPAVNLRGLAPFKSEHRNDLELDALMQWQALYGEGRELQQAGEFPAALEKYREALAVDDRYAELHFRTGQVLFEQQHYADAQAAFERAVEEDVAPLRILASMQRVIADIAVEEKAPLIDFHAIMKQTYSNEYGHTVFGDEYFTDHVHTNAEGYRKLGMALFDHLVGQGIARPEPTWNAENIDAVRRGILASTDREDEGITLLNLGAVFEWAGKFEEARAKLLRALDILGPTEEVLLRLASSSYAIGEVDDAFGYLKDMQALQPGMHGLNSKLAMIQLERGDPDEALAYCKAELGIDPHNHFPHVCMAKSLAALGKPAEAQPYFDKAVQLGPNSEFAHLSYAQFLIGQQRYREALVHGREALRINPAAYEAHNAVASVMIHRGDLDLARYHVSEALRLKPDYAPARHTLEAVRSRLDGTAASQHRPCAGDPAAC